MAKQGERHVLPEGVYRIYRCPVCAELVERLKEIQDAVGGPPPKRSSGWGTPDAAAMDEMAAEVWRIAEEALAALQPEQPES